MQQANQRDLRLQEGQPGGAPRDARGEAAGRERVQGAEGPAHRLRHGLRRSLGGAGLLSTTRDADAAWHAAGAAAWAAATAARDASAAARDAATAARDADAAPSPTSAASP